MIYTRKLFPSFSVRMISRYSGIMPPPTYIVMTNSSVKTLWNTKSLRLKV